MFLIAAIICFTIGLLGQLQAFNGVDVLAWTIGGLLAWALEQAIGGRLPVVLHRQQ